MPKQAGTMFRNERGKNRKGQDLACIFVHAGAGFHSLENEFHHLKACQDACKAGMAVMNNGGSAVDAVEIAIKVLEDREVTNSGYGSNLSQGGVVECDAIIVDQNGTSGAAGAVAQIKNPVSLARLILDHSAKTLSLRRVPPNLLVGQGATNFAKLHGMEAVPFTAMISPGARTRWRKWRYDMIKVERKEQLEDDERFSTMIQTLGSNREFSQTVNDHEGAEAKRKAHEDRMYAEAVAWGEQIASPPPPDVLKKNSLATPARSRSGYSEDFGDDTGATTPDRHPDEASDPNPLHRPNTTGSPGGMANHPFANSTQSSPPASSTSLPKLINGAKTISRHSSRQTSPPSSYTALPKLVNGARTASAPSSYTATPNVIYDANRGDNHFQDDSDENMDDFFDTYVQHSPPRQVDALLNGSKSRESSMLDGHDDNSAAVSCEPSVRFDSSTGTYHVVPESSTHPRPDPQPSTTSNTTDHPLPPASSTGGEDLITDTVGAIAIDMFGNIACAASSGGIGMKHRGRVGPAALISVGAAVIPVDDDDPDGQSVATVTSGTGEHMTTTMAAGLCSERIYQCQRKVRGKYQTCMEEEAITGFIKTDFMDHPSVRSSRNTAAIGTLSVKKTKDGVYFLFGHNTDSFALASMHSDEDRPVMTMSRSNGNGSIAQGGRYVRYRRSSARK